MFSRIENGDPAKLLRLSFLFLVFGTIFLRQASVASSVVDEIRVTESDADWKLWLQFNVYSIDLKTETLSTSRYNLEFWSFDNTSAIRGAVFKSDKTGSHGFFTEPIEGTERQRFYDEIATDPTKVIPWEWKLHPRQRLLRLGSPFDCYELSLLIALNETVRLKLNSTDFLMPTTLRGEWEYTENLERLTKVPTNGTLRLHGISPETFAFYKGNEMIDFYLYTVVLEPVSTTVLRMFLAFLLPPMVIFILLVLVAYARLRRRLHKSDLLRIYLAVAFFILPFWVSFYQYAPPAVFTWQELLFLLDFCFATFLVSHAILRKEDSNENQKEEEPRSNLVTPTQTTKDVCKRIDRLFEIGLLLATVLSASILQYVSAKSAYEENLTDLHFAFRELTIPIVVMILFWLIKELFPRRSLKWLHLKRWAKEFCWTFLSNFLVLGILSFIIVSFTTDTNLLSSITATMVVIALLLTFPISFNYRKCEQENRKSKSRRRFLAMTIPEHTIIFVISLLILIGIIAISSLPVP